MSEFDNNNVGISNNNNDNTVKSHRSPYKARERQHKIHEIERLLTLGYNRAYIQQKLGISEPTYNRYRKQAFAESKAAMLGLDIDFAMEKISESDRRFGELADHAIKLIQDTTMDGDSRVAALSVACEIEKQRVIFLLKDGPEIISRLKGYPKTIERVVEVIANKHNLPQLIKKAADNNNNNNNSRTA